MGNRQITRRHFTRILAGTACASVIGDVGKVPAADGQRDNFSFGVITDVQYCDAAVGGTRHYRASPKKLAECVDTLNQLDLAFAIHLGDFIDRDVTSFEVVNPIYARLKHPRYHVLGNHDFSVAEDRLNDVPKILGMPSRYYRFRSNGWRFVVLDGNDLSLLAHAKGSPQYERAQTVFEALKKRKALNAQTWNGAVGEEQLAWLDAQLREAGQAGERAVVFCHFPVYPTNVHNLWNDVEVVKLLHAHDCVAAYFNGHNHAGNYGESGGVHYLTFSGMVETPDTTAFAVVHLRDNRLEIEGYGRVSNRLLKLRE